MTDILAIREAIQKWAFIGQQIANLRRLRDGRIPHPFIWGTS
jgi:hypothetical protein